MSILIKKTFCTLLCVVLLFNFTACSLNTNKTEKYQTTFLDLFDTASTITAYDESEDTFNEHAEAFHDKLEEYYELYDIYNTYDGITNICTLNNEAKDGPVEVDEKIIDLLEYCVEIYEMSAGLTNICMGTVLSIWHDARENGLDDPDNATLPSMSELESANEHTDINSLVIDSENNTVYFSDPELQLDVGAIAKGFAVREVCEWAEENLWSAATISVGGNVCTFGYKENDGETPWTVAIENPNEDSSDYLVTLNVTNTSVVTSGDYQRYYTVDGVDYCHIINPETLMPATYMHSVSVICDDSAYGDALSTTLFNMSVEDGLEFVESLDGVEAIWVDNDYNETKSSGFDEYVAE